MHIGIASPISIQKFIPYLYTQSADIAINIQGLKAPAVDTLAIGLLNAGHQISIYTLSYEIVKPIILHGERLSIFINPLRVKGWKRAFSFFKIESNYIKENIKSENPKPDVLHAHWTYEYALGVIPFKDEIPVFVTVRDWAPTILKLTLNYYRFFRLIINNYIFKQKNVNFIANSKYIAQKIKKRWKKDAFYIPNPINEEYINTKSQQTQVRKYLISVSNNLGKGKNIEKLLMAFSQVKLDFPNLRMILVGIPFTENNHQIKKWTELGLMGNTVLKGSVEHTQLINLYDQSVIMVHPSVEESFGNTIIEGMSRKVAVIGGQNSGAVPFLLQNGKNGILTDVKDVNSIKDSIEYLLMNELKRNIIIENAYQFVKNNFSQDLIINKTIDLYETKKNE